MASTPMLRTRRDFLRRLPAGTLLMAGGYSLLSAQNEMGALRNDRKKLGVALVGLGSYATGQLGPALRETRYCHLTGVVTGDPAKGRRWAREYGFPESSVYGYDTMHRMADNSDIDIVYSVTPPSLHKRDAIRGFEAGKHVISEKPMAVSVEQCDAMIAAAKAAEKQLSIGYRLHFHPCYERVKEMAGSGESAFREIAGGFGFNSSGNDSWRMRREMGGGPLMDVGIYVIYCACMAKNEVLPVAVTAEKPPVKRPEIFKDVEEAIEFKLEWGDGSTCAGETSWSKASNYFRASGPAGEVEMEPAYSYRGLRVQIDGEALPSRDDFNQQAHQMDAFAKAIIDETPSIVPGEMGRREIQIIAAIFEAARTGERVELR